jgi:hypothetical protein
MIISINGNRNSFPAMRSREDSRLLRNSYAATFVRGVGEKGSYVIGRRQEIGLATEAGRRTGSQISWLRIATAPERKSPVPAPP